VLACEATVVDRASVIGTIRLGPSRTAVLAVELVPVVLVAAVVAANEAAVVAVCVAALVVSLVADVLGARATVLVAVVVEQPTPRCLQHHMLCSEVHEGATLSIAKIPNSQENFTPPVMMVRVGVVPLAVGVAVAVAVFVSAVLVAVVVVVV